MRRTLNCDLQFARSTHPTIADPSLRSATLIRPPELTSSTRMAGPNVRPLSCEYATYERFCSLGAVNHATMTSPSRAAIAGPLIGQPAILKLSLWTGIGGDHRPAARRVT